ncbi:MFS transporter [Phaeacidiphilus oryzae]|uniref:MFS transporter n=1 Tax=Phaeacidiphilus oryzae TaxID=348818 RepID=UPI00389A9203
MAMLDGTVVNIALPHIGAELSAPLSVLQWIMNAYLLALAGLILLGGGLGDRYGRRRLLVTGTVWFAAASALCALAPNAGVLVAARAGQGVGAALLTPGSLALIQSAFHPDDRAKAVGAWSGLGGMATAVGPFLGGWLVDGPGWRWIFLINVPLAAVVVALAVLRVPESRDWRATGRFDAPGAALAALALAGITYALIAASGSPSPMRVALPAAAGVLLGALFVLVERRGRHPMLPLSLFSSALFVRVNAVTLCLYAAIGGVFFLLPVALQTGLGFSALGAGVATIPITVLMLTLSSPAGALAGRIGPRLPLTAGPLLSAGGLVLLARVGAGSGYWTTVFPGVVVMGLGMSLFVAPLTATVLASVPVERSGIASGVNNAAARAAQLLAVAALPLATGLSGRAYASPDAVLRAFRESALICAGLMLAAALAAWTTVRADTLRPGPAGGEPAEPRCTRFGHPTAPPLEPGS